MVSQALDTLTNMSATAKLQQNKQNKLSFDHEFVLVPV